MTLAPHDNNKGNELNQPKFITFTGADDQTSIEGMCELSEQYPIEWGILFSPKLQGSGRYPTMEFIKKLAGYNYLVLDLSAHLCGGDSRSVIDGAGSQHNEIIRSRFQRVQINSSNPSIDTGEIFEWADPMKVRAILQCRTVFPNDPLVDFLFDASGGRGITPEAWPESRGTVLRGYAGGLNPSNVAAAVHSIGEIVENYWIDMETGVRTDDKFDLDKCRAVCQAVYGGRA